MTTNTIQKTNIPRRVVIYPKDIECITGKSASASRNLLGLIRKRFDKKKGQFVTVSEFCDYTGIREEEAVRRLSL